MFMNNEKTIFELSVPGRKGFQFPDADVPETELPAGLGDMNKYLSRRITAVA